MSRGRGFGRGYGFFGRGVSWAGGGRGFANAQPFCRWYPWLPRRWWAYSATPPQAPPFGASLPTYNKDQERQMLTQQIEILEAQLEAIRKRLDELSK